MQRRGVLIKKNPGRRRFRIDSWPHLLPHHAQALVSWARRCHRSYPWREAVSPFAKLVGEMLLRKTSARHALQAYEDLMAMYPTATALMQAETDDLARVLRPLGMVRQRIAGLRHMARFLVEHYGGEVPASPGELMRIPHVGRYTANALCCFAFGLPLPIVDTNVVRVLHRFTGRGKPGPRAHTKVEFWRRMASSLPDQEVDWFNYGLLDLGAAVCRPEPSCGECPLWSGCSYARKKQQGARR